MKGRPPLARGAVSLLLRAIQASDRLRLRWLGARHPGLAIHPAASTNFAVARYSLEPGARLEIEPGAVTDRRPGFLHFSLAAGAHVRVRESAWLRTEIWPITIVAFAGGRIEIGPEALLNGCHLSAKESVVLGRRAWVGPGARVFDADQHDFDAEHPERIAPVEIGDHVWIAADATVHRGVTIGAHSIVAARSLVNRSIPPHSWVAGVPAVLRGEVGDRSKAR